MAGETPFFVTGKVAEILSAMELIIIKVSNGNLYHLYPSTPGIEDFYSLKVGQNIRCEVTFRLNRILSASIIDIAGECDGSTLGS